MTTLILVGLSLSFVEILLTITQHRITARAMALLPKLFSLPFLERYDDHDITVVDSSDEISNITVESSYASSPGIYLPRIADQGCHHKEFLKLMETSNLRFAYGSSPSETEYVAQMSAIDFMSSKGFTYKLAAHEVDIWVKDKKISCDIVLYSPHGKTGTFAFIEAKRRDLNSTLKQAHKRALYLSPVLKGFGLKFYAYTQEAGQIRRVEVLESQSGEERISKPIIKDELAMRAFYEDRKRRREIQVLTGYIIAGMSPGFHNHRTASFAALMKYRCALMGISEYLSEPLSRSFAQELAGTFIREGLVDFIYSEGYLIDLKIVSQS